MTGTRKLTRASNDKVLGGVSGGLARYLDVDAGIVRIVTALLVLFTGFGAVLYLIMWAVLPDDFGATGIDQLRGSSKRNGQTYPPAEPQAYQPYQPNQPQGPQDHDPQI